MSTQADGDVQRAIESISAVIVHRCWGHEEYNAAYTTELENILRELLAIRRRLNR